MSLFDAFRYDGKRVLVVGGATGMGGAAAQLARDAGGEVVAMDYAPITHEGVQGIKVNLAEKESIDAAIAEAGGKFDVLMSCAGIADAPGIERINFIGHKYMIEQMLANGMLGRGSAIGMISSAAGLGWESNLELMQEFIAITDWDEAVKWALDNNKADYLHMKQAMCCYVATNAFKFLQQGIRINAICPGPTDTPLAQANKEMWLGFGADYRADAGVEASTPLEQANLLVFLCSDAAAAVSGQTVISDMGYLASGLTNSYPAANMTAQFLFGRLSF